MNSSIEESTRIDSGLRLGVDEFDAPFVNSFNFDKLEVIYKNLTACEKSKVDKNKIKREFENICFNCGS